MWVARRRFGGAPRPDVDAAGRQSEIVADARCLRLAGCQSAAVNVSGQSVRQVANASRRRDVSVPNRTLRAVGQERLSLVSGS